MKYLTHLLFYPLLLSSILFSSFSLPPAYATNRPFAFIQPSPVNTPIMQVGHPVLRQIAAPVLLEDILSPDIQQLITVMQDTMRQAPGVGLAAPQIGIPLQIAVIEDKKEYIDRLTPEEAIERDRHPVAFHVIINPTLTIIKADEQASFYEGCLSLAGYVARVPRALHVKVNALNEKGEPIEIEAAGWYARILQHEIGHLNGTLYIDHMEPKTFTTIDNYKLFPH